MPTTRSTPTATHSTQFLTPNELASRWGVTTEWLYRSVLGAPDGLKAIRLGRGPRARWRIRVSDVEAYEQSNEVQYKQVHV